MLTNEQKLKAIRTRFKLSYNDIHGLLKISKYSIKCWFSNPESSIHRKISDQMLELLYLKLAMLHGHFSIEEEK